MSEKRSHLVEASNKASVADDFKIHLEKLGERPTVEVDKLPDGFPKVQEWKMLYTDVQLALEKQFKKEYNLVGVKERAGEVIDKVGDVKHVRISTLYFPYRILQRSVIEAKFKNEYDKRPRVLAYNNKFVPWDREAFQLLGMHIFCGKSLLGPCRIVDLSGLTQEDFGNVLGKKNVQRTKAVFDFLGVPERSEEPETAETDGDGNKLTQHQRDLFDTGSDKETVTLRLAKPEEADITLKSLDKVENRAHKIRATLLGIQRIKAALQNAEDPEKKKNLKKSLSKFLKFKQRHID